MLTEAWTPLRWHAKQDYLWRAKEQFICVAAGRGSGKTDLHRRYVVRWLPVKKPWQNPMYFYGLPTRQQAKRVAWRELCALIPRSWVAKEYASDMMIRTIFGSELWVVGLDKPQRIEGNQWDGGVLDECSDIRPGTFARSVLPALSHKRGWCRRIGVPKRFGVGAIEFKQACLDAEQDASGDSKYLTWPSSDILTEEQLAWPRKTLDPRDYREQYQASWETAAGCVFHAFDPVANVVEVQYQPNEVLIIGSDFNVDPMCWTINQRTPDGKHFNTLDEIVLRNTNTLATLDELHRRFGSHKAGFDFYGDASGRARKTSASRSDYLQIRNDTRFARARVFYPKANPALKDRFASCNALLCNAEGERRAQIHPRCKRLIADLANRAYEEGSSVPDDEGDMGHASDAWGYPVHALYHLRLVQTQAPRIMINTSGAR